MRGVRVALEARHCDAVRERAGAGVYDEGGLELRCDTLQGQAIVDGDESQSVPVCEAWRRRGASVCLGGGGEVVVGSSS